MESGRTCIHFDIATVSIADFTLSTRRIKTYMKQWICSSFRLWRGAYLCHFMNYASVCLKVARLFSNVEKSFRCRVNGLLRLYISKYYEFDHQFQDYWSHQSKRGNIFSRRFLYHLVPGRVSFSHIKYT